MHSLMVDKVLAEVMEPTYESLRAEHMGWTFHKPIITPVPFEMQTIGRRFVLRADFTCVCGKRETFNYAAGELDGFRGLNVPLWLTNHGSFSRAHLMRDGYTEEQIREIERKGEEFDRIVVDRVIRSAMRGDGLLGQLDRQRMHRVLMEADRHAC